MRIRRKDRDHRTVFDIDDKWLARRPGEHWSIYVYPPDSEGPILGYASASTLTDALREAGLSGDDAGETGDDAGETLGRAGV